ncbi:MAG: hypothetical protein K6E30_01655 [Lachnospiraceae bacterium]|nr:hypothetical protein [Lachnospiraceae bacterium]
MISLDAEKYRKKGFERAYFDEVYRYICERMKYKTPHAVGTGRVMKELAWCLKEYGLLTVLLSEEVQSKKFEDLNSEDFIDIMKALVLADAGTLKEMYKILREKKFAENFIKAKALVKADKDKKTKLEEPFKFLDYFAKNAYEGMLKLEVNVPQISEEKREIPIMMVQGLDIRTCPYCNRVFIGSVKNKKLGVQLDHFYSKSNYPFFAVSLYNLIPCCSSCNMNKRDDDEKKLRSPFDKKYSFAEDVKFVFEEVQQGCEGGEEKKAWKVHFKMLSDDPEKNREYEANIDEFKLDAAYDFHFIEAKRFREKMLAYPPSLLREMARNMSVTDEDGNIVEKIPAEALEMGLFQEYFCEPADYIKKPFAKFYRDLYFQYRGWE